MNDIDHVPSSPKLIVCQTCGKEISKFAATCPGCGAPNKWMHHKITSFLENKNNLQMDFKFTYTATSIKGEAVVEFNSITESLKGYATCILVIAPFAILWAFFDHPFIGAAISIALYFLMKDADSYNKRIETFEFDAETDVWKCSNDEYWKAVKDFLFLQQ